VQTNGMPLDYASLDQADEQLAHQLLQEQIERGQQRRRQRAKTALPTAPPQLPLGMMGQASQVASELMSIAAKCGQDRACWEKDLAARRAPIGASF